jgi:thiol-disulfide isomerase/thioredoxin
VRRVAVATPLLCLALCLAACSASDRDADGAARTPAPDFSLPDLAGNTVSLSDFRGRPVVIDFWATWCPPCVFQVPELNALWEAHREAGDLAVVGVAVDVEGAEVVAPWASEQGVGYTILIGDEELARKFGVLGFPTLVLVDPEGAIDSLHVGLIEHAELEDLVAPLASQVSRREIPPDEAGFAR